MYPYRAFLSYSSDEREIATAAAAALTEIGLRVFWDYALAPGEPFPDEIKAHIARSHLFVPLLTPRSIVRPWVHQETGFAMGAGVPVLPIVVGNSSLVPVALTQQLQAVRIDDDFARLKTALTEAVISSRVEKSGRMGHPSFESVDHPERRSQVLAEYAREAWQRGGGRLRHRGAMTSFALPAVPASDAIWRQRDGLVERSPFLHVQQYEERMALGELAATYGCDLIVNPDIRLDRYGPAARKLRLETLRAFLLDVRSYPDVRAMVRPDAGLGNIILVGDWFYAESLTPQDGAGYRQTHFTWHAPTVLARIRQFDASFTGESSRYVAADLIKRVIDSIDDPV